MVYSVQYALFFKIDCFEKSKIWFICFVAIDNQFIIITISLDIFF